MALYMILRFVTQATNRMELAMVPRFREGALSLVSHGRGRKRHPYDGQLCSNRALDPTRKLVEKDEGCCPGRTQAAAYGVE